MTRTEALELLGVDEQAGAEQIRKKYGELYNEYQLRLTNAPTPNLKKLYHKNLEELNEAQEILIASEAARKMGQLPSSAPVYDQWQLSGNRELVEVKPPEPKPRATTSGKRPKLSLVIGLGSALILAVGVITWQAWRYTRRLNEAGAWEAHSLGLMTTKDSLLTARQIELNALYPIQSRHHELIDPGRFQIRNDGRTSFVIFLCEMSYWDDSGSMHKLSSNKSVKVRSGETIDLARELRIEDDTGDPWDGSVSLYAIVIHRADGDWYWLRSGIWNYDSFDGVLSLNID